MAMPNILIIGADSSQIKIKLSDLYQQYLLQPEQIFEVNTELVPLLIDQLREVIRLTNRAYVKPTAFVIWNFGTASEIVQNTFLKTLEEHQPNIIFILISQTNTSVLPTIQSRCQVVYLTAPKLILDQTIEKEMAAILQQALKNQPFLISQVLKLSIKNKRTEALLFLQKMISYLTIKIPEAKEKKWLASKANLALIAKQLIEVNNVDPQLALDMIFLAD
jgi:hypothetical protein